MRAFQTAGGLRCSFNGATVMPVTASLGSDKGTFVQREGHLLTNDFELAGIAGDFANQPLPSKSIYLNYARLYLINFTSVRTRDSVPEAERFPDFESHLNWPVSIPLYADDYGEQPYIELILP